MEVGSIACFTPKSCNNLILQVIQTKQRHDVTGKVSSIPSNKVKGKKCSIVHNKKESCGIVKFPYRNQWKKALSNSIVSSVNHVIDQCPILKTNMFLLRKKRYVGKKGFGNENGDHSDVNDLSKDDRSICLGSFLGYKIKNEKIMVETKDDEFDYFVQSRVENKIEDDVEICIRSFLNEQVKEGGLENNDEVVQESELCIRSFLENDSYTATCSLVKASWSEEDISNVSVEDKELAQNGATQEVCDRSFVDEIVSNIKKKELSSSEKGTNSDVYGSLLEDVLNEESEQSERLRNAQKLPLDQDYATQEVCSRSFVDEAIRSKAKIFIAKKNESEGDEPPQVCPRLFWKEISLSEMEIDEEPQDQNVIMETICYRSFLDEHIINKLDEIEAEDSNKETEAEAELVSMNSLVNEGKELCLDEHLFIALMNYKPNSVCDTFIDIPKYEEQNKTEMLILSQNVTLRPTLDPSDFKIIDATYSFQILQDDHMAPLLYFSIGILSGILVFFFVILQKNGKFITDDIPCCAESQTSSTYSNAQPPPSQVLQEQIQILAPDGPLGIILLPSANGPTIFCINPKGPMIGIFYPGDIIVALDMEDVREWKVDFLASRIIRKAKKPRLFTILR